MKYRDNKRQKEKHDMQGGEGVWGSKGAAIFSLSLTDFGHAMNDHYNLTITEEK